MRAASARRSASALRRLESVGTVIHLVRGQRVLLAADLATIDGVTTKALNQAVKRNIRRFPPDFAFRLSRREAAETQLSRSQSVTLKRGANIKYAPMAFTEHGAVMVATVLNSRRAAHMSVYVVRAFVRLREWALGQAGVAQRLDDIEARLGSHDQELKAVINALRRLVASPDVPRRRIGFR
jgi:hypothetical protein